MKLYRPQSRSRSFIHCPTRAIWCPASVKNRIHHTSVEQVDTSATHGQAHNMWSTGDSKMQSGIIAAFHVVAAQFQH